MLRRILIAVAFVLALPGVASAADLHATPSTFASQFAAATGGDRVLLASGAYGQFPNASKSAPGVTVTEETGASATFSSTDFNSTTNYVTIQGITWTGPVEVRPGATSMHLIFDGNTWGAIDRSTSGPEGRLSIIGGGSNALHSNGVQIKNSTFGPGGCSDGIQDSSKGTEIGPDNVFKGIVQSCSSSLAHVDAIQPYDSNYIHIHDNLLDMNEQGIMAPDGPSTGWLIENNAISTTNAYPSITLGHTINGTVRHNVSINGNIRVYGGNEGVPSSGMVVQDNVGGVNNDSCTGCTISNNPTSGVTFTGTPAGTRCAWATASPKGTATDGTDVGLNDCGAPPPNPECSDGINNDPTEDTLIDYPNDPGCSSATDNSEAGNPPPPPTPQCSDGVDNSDPEDTLADYPADPGCSSATDDDETDAPVDHQPVARFTASPEPSAPGQTVTFDATASTCQDTPCGYTWKDTGPPVNGSCAGTTSNWPVGPAGGGSVITQSFSGTGVKCVTLTVTDADGDTDVVEHDHTVTSSPPPPPPDTTAPDTSITSAPSNGTSTSASVSFTGTDNVGVTGFDCRIDGGAYSACTSPKSYTGLSVGSHTVDVRAKDAAGNVDASPASATWTITQPSASATFVAEYEVSSWTSTGAGTKSVSVSYSAGDTLVAYAGSEDAGYPVGFSLSQAGLTWTLQKSVVVASYATAYVWTASASANGSGTVSFTGNSAHEWGGDVLRYSGVSAVGTSVKANFPTTPSIPSMGITTTGSGSAIVWFSTDWNAKDGASRSWRTSGIGTGFAETTYASHVLTTYSAYGGRWSGVSPGTYTVGLTAPSGQRWSAVAVELKG